MPFTILKLGNIHKKLIVTTLRACYTRTVIKVFLFEAHLSMTTRLSDTAIITDQQAEGSPEAHEEREPASPRQTITVPSVRPNTLRASPVAETGVVAAVVLPGEGADDRE